MSHNQNEIIRAQDLQSSLDVVKTSDGLYRPQQVTVMLHPSEVDKIQGNDFISADAYARLAQAAAISFQQLDKEMKYDAVGKLNSVYLSVRGIWRNPAGELQVVEESMELRIEELIAEQRSKVAKKNNIAGLPVYDSEGNLIRVEYKLPPQIEADLWEDSLRMRVFLERKCMTRIRARITKAMTGVTPKSLPRPDKFGMRYVKVTRMLPIGMINQEPEVIDGDYQVMPQEEAIKETNQTQQPSVEPETQATQVDSLLDSENWACMICGEIIPEKERDYFRKNPSYKRQHYKCYQQQKNGR